MAAEEGPAPERLRTWLDLLVSSKRSRALDDPELFDTYTELAAGARAVVKAHVDSLVAQLITDGVDQGAFAVTDPVVAGRAVFDATARSITQPTHRRGPTPASMPPSKVFGR